MIARANTDRDYYTVPEVARRIRVNTRKVMTWIRSGRLRAINVGGGAQRPRYRVAKCDLEIFLATLDITPAPVQSRRQRPRQTEVIEFVK